MTPNARFIVFSSKATNFPCNTPPCSNGKFQIYRFEQGATGTGGQLVHVSKTESGPIAPADCLMPSISDDGTRVVFHTTAKLLTAPPNADNDNVSDVYIFQLNTGTVTRVSAPRVAGVRGNSYGAAISGNGQFVAFTSAASDLVGDANGTILDVFRFDVAANSLDIASVNNGSTQSGMPLSTIGDELGCAPPPAVQDLRVGSVISDDGSRVIMCGTPCDWAAELCPAPFSFCTGCTVAANCTDCPLGPATQQIYLRDFVRADAGQTATFLVSTRPDIDPMTGDCDGNVAGDACSRRPSISGDGSRIAFSSFARRFRNDVLLDPDTMEDVFFIDVQLLIDGNGQCVPPLRVSVALCNAVTDGHSFQPMLSMDGTRIAFASDATTLLAGTPPCPDANGARDVFIRKTTSPTATIRFSVSSAGVAGNGASMNPEVSGDGMIALYQSLATNLLGPNGDQNGQQDIFQSPSPQGPFIRGDVNLDAVINLTDAVRITNWLFLGGPIPACLDAADANDSGNVDLADFNYINNFLFLSGPPPPCPFCCSAIASCCGKDPTGDGLPCGQTIVGCTTFSAQGTCPVAVHRLVSKGHMILSV